MVFGVWGELGLWDYRVIHEKRFRFINILNDRDSGRNKKFLLRFLF